MLYSGERRMTGQLVMVVTIIELYYVCLKVPLQWMMPTLDYLTFINLFFFIFNLDSSSSDPLFSVEADFVLRFTSNGIWNPPVSIISSNYLDRAVKYDQHIWRIHALTISVRMLDNCKNLSNILSGLSCMSIPLYFFHSCFISEIRRNTSWTLHELSIELCMT